MKSSNSEKFWLKPLKIAIFGPNLHKKGSVRATPKTNIIFFAEMTKADHKLSKIFYFMKISCFDWVMNVFLFCGDVFLLKRVISSHNNCGPLIRPQIRPQVWLLTLIVRCWLNACHLERVVNFVTNKTVYYIVYPAKITLNLKEHLEIRGYGSYY